MNEPEISHEEKAYLFQISDLIQRVVHMEGDAIRLAEETAEQFQRLVEANEELSGRVIELVEELSEYTTDVDPKAKIEALAQEASLWEDDADEPIPVGDWLGEWPGIETKIASVDE